MKHALRFLFILLVLCSSRSSAQTVMGKHPFDTFTASFWAQNTNANSVAYGLNNFATVPLTNNSIFSVWFQSHMLAGANITFTTNPTTKAVTIAATGGGGGVTAFADLTGKPTTLGGYGITDAESPLTFSGALSRTLNAVTVTTGTTAGTVAAGNDSRLSGARTPAGAAGGDLGGTYPNPTIPSTIARKTDATNAVLGSAYLRTTNVVPAGATYNYTISGGPNDGLAGCNVTVLSGGRYYYFLPTGADDDLFLMNGSESVTSGSSFTAASSTVTLVGLSESVPTLAQINSGVASYYGNFSGTASNLTDIPIEAVDTLTARGVFNDRPLLVLASGGLEHRVVATNTSNRSTFAIENRSANGYADIGFYLDPTGGGVNSRQLRWALGVGGPTADFPYRQPFFESYLSAEDIVFVGAGKIYWGFRRLKGNLVVYGTTTNDVIYEIDIPTKTISNNVTTVFSSNATFITLSASTVPVLNSSKVLVSSSTTDTELGYVHGVTNSIQTQLNGKAAVCPVKIYRALLTQSAETAPTAVVLENTLGGIPTFTYNDEGTYSIELIGAFPANKTFLSSGVIDAINHSVYSMSRIDNDGINISTGTNDGPLNGQLNSTAIEIRVYLP